MAKTWIVQNITNIGSVNFVLEAGKLKKLLVNVELNLGTEGKSETIDILPKLTSPDEIGKAEALFKGIKRELEKIYLA